MVRTLDSGSRASGGKAPRKGISTPSSSSSNSSSKATSGSSGAGGGGNPVCPRDTPSWQKSISTFFIKNDNPDKPENKQIEKDEVKESAKNDDKPVDKKMKLSTKNNEDEEKENEPSGSNSEDKPRRKRLIIDDDDD